MKNKLTPYKILALVVAILAFGLTSCKKDGSAQSIVGTWTTMFFGSKDVVNQYQFKSDGSVEFDVYKIDTTTKKATGFETKFVGKYTLNGTTLNITNIEYLVNPTYAFGPLKELVPMGGPATSTNTIAFNAEKNQMSIYFICPPNADCIPSPIIYHRQ
jgi:hypothetical protein